MASMLLFLLLLSISLLISNSIQELGFCGIGCGTEFGEGFGKILIKGGTVVNAHHKEVADVYVEDGIVVAVRPYIMQIGDDVTVIDATGKYVMPGGIDPHTHLEMDFMGTQTIDDFITGQSAALAGGTTMHIDFVIPVNGSLTAGFDQYVDKAKKSVMDYGFHMAVTKWDETVLKDMEIMVNEKGINSFKFFMAYKGSLMINDDLLLQAFEKCKSLGALAMVHTENGDGVAEGQKKMIDLGITGPEGHVLSRPRVPFQRKKLDLAIYTFDDREELTEPHQDKGRSCDDECKATSARDSFVLDLNSRSSSFEEGGTTDVGDQEAKVRELIGCQHEGEILYFRFLQYSRRHQWPNQLTQEIAVRFFLSTRTPHAFHGGERSKSRHWDHSCPQVEFATSVRGATLRWYMPFDPGGVSLGGFISLGISFSHGVISIDHGHVLFDPSGTCLRELKISSSCRQMIGKRRLWDHTFSQAEFAKDGLNSR